MVERSTWGKQAERKADAAAGREGKEKQTDAIGEGLAAVAFGLLDVAAAIREHTEVTKAAHGLEDD